MQRLWAAAPYSHTNPVRNVRLMRPELPMGFGYGTSPYHDHLTPMDEMLVDQKRRRARAAEHALLFELEHEGRTIEDGTGEVVVPGPLP